MLLGILNEIVKSMRQFSSIDDPVAKGGIVGVALELTAKTAIVHHKELATH